MEHSAGAVIFYKSKKGIEFLLLHYPSSGQNSEGDYWDFPKGHLEEGEREAEAAKREILEETGLKIPRFVKGFRYPIYYFFQKDKKRVFKMVAFFLARSSGKKVRISSEHLGYQWLPFGEAVKKLKFRNAREVLKRAYEFIKENEL